MKAPAFLNLPVQSGGVRIVNVHAINAEVVFLRHRMFGIDQRQRNKRPAVFLPGSQDRQFVKTHLLLNHFRDRRARHFARPEPEKIAH